MPKEKSKKLLSVESLRYSEYYGQQETFDNLYAMSKNGENFTNLMEFILQRENILLAYRNIKGNSGRVTPGTDKLKIKDIGSLTPDEMVEKVKTIVQGGGLPPKTCAPKGYPKTRWKHPTFGYSMYLGQIDTAMCQAKNAED